MKKVIYLIPLLLLLLASCIATPQKPLEGVAACPLPPKSKNLDEGLRQIKAFLSSNPYCNTLYEDYFLAALQIATQNPGIENRGKFAKFLSWSRDNGIITQKEGKNYFNRFFNPKYISISGNYNNCSQIDKREAILKSARDEMNDKKTGLMHVLNQPKLFKMSQNLYMDLDYMYSEVLSKTCDLGS